MFRLLSLLFSLPLLLSSPISPIVPVVIWHGLGDRYDAPGLLALKSDLENRKDLKGIFVHILALAEDGSSDQRATFFGSANSQISFACAQIRALPQIMDPDLNPSGSGVFDAIGFSQGGQLLRGLVERCGGSQEGSLLVRNLITLGSQHMGISSLPPCPPNSSPLSPCKLMHLSLVREGLYSPFAQQNILPAQYFRDQKRIEEYMNVNGFLRDINNERKGDRQVELPEEEEGWVVLKRDEEEPEPEPRNQTYKANLSNLTNLVLFRFTQDLTVIPPHSAHFTLPSPYATNCPSPLPPGNPCYADPLPWSYLPLYNEDYIGLKELDSGNRIALRECEGEHMQIGEECWEDVVEWLGGKGKTFESEKKGKEGQGRLVLQL